MAFRTASEKKMAPGQQGDKAASEPSCRLSRPVSSDTSTPDEPWTLFRWKSLSSEEEPFNPAKTSLTYANGHNYFKGIELKATVVADPAFTTLDKNMRPAKAKTADLGAPAPHQRYRLLSADRKDNSRDANTKVKQDNLKRPNPSQQSPDLMFIGAHLLIEQDENDPSMPTSGPATKRRR